MVIRRNQWKRWVRNIIQRQRDRRTQRPQSAVPSVEAVETRVLLSAVGPSFGADAFHTTINDEIAPGAVIQRSTIDSEDVSGGDQFFGAPAFPGGGDNLNGNGLEFNFNPASGMPQTAIDGFQAAADLWSSILTDDIVVNIDIDFRSLNPGILGQASSTTESMSISTFRTNLTADRTSLSDIDAVASLPGGSSFSIYTSDPSNGIPGDPIIDNNGSGNNIFLDINTSTSKAIGVRAAGNTGRDASITFSSNFTWDFDRSDGITSGAFDFVGVAAHEIGHALGFRSGVDVVDATSGAGGSAGTNLDNFRVSTALDMFRFSAGSIANGTDIDMRADTDQKSFSVDDGATTLTTFSTGRANGDGQQASHWKDSLGIGIMDPTAAPGEFADVTDLDVQAFDVIGWDVRMDFGDAPDPTYDTLLASNGPRHITFDADGTVVNPAGNPVVFLGSGVENETDGEQNATASGDTDDGLATVPDLEQGAVIDLEVSSSANNAILNYFVDFNQNGSFADPGEAFAATLTSATQTVPVTVPADATLGTTILRFRISSAGSLTAVGPADDGEVEDYQIDVIAAAGGPVLNEPFNDRSQFTISDADGTATFFSDGFSDYFGIADGGGDGGEDFGGDSVPANLPGYAGADDNFLVGQDMDGEGASLPFTLNWAGLNITGLSNLEFSGRFAEFRSNSIDAADFIRVEAQIDNGGFAPVLEFRGNGDGSNEEFAVDTDGDGVGDGVVLDENLQGFTVPISGSGNTLDLRLVLGLNSGGEDFAIDDFIVDEAAPDTTPPTVTNLTPADDSSAASPTANFQITFDEFVQAGTGNLIVRLASDDSVVETIDMTGSAVSYNGDTVEIDPAVTLAFSTAYYINIDGGAVEDIQGNPFAGITDKTTWNFTTSPPSVLNDIVFNEVLADPNSSGSFNFDTDGDGTAETADEFVEIYNTSGGALDISGLQFWDSGSGNYFTIPASTTLGAGGFVVVVANTAGGDVPTVPAGSHAFSANGGLSISNGGDNMVLYDPATDQFIQALFNGDAVDNPASTYSGFSATASLIGSVLNFGDDRDGVSLALSPDGDISNPVRHNTIGDGSVLASPGNSNFAPDTITLEISPAAISENGGVAAGTISRTGDTSAALTVTLVSSDTTEATVPASVTIPIGQASISFDVTAVDDAIVDGTQTVTVTASAGGFDDTGDTLDVSDDDRNFPLQILHASDLEGGVDAIDRAANFGAVVDALEADAASQSIGSILLSAGDNYIPGPFFNAAGDFALRDDLQSAYQTLFSEAGLTNIREGVGRVDISIMNILGFDASAVGNHEFDAGPDTFADLIGSDIRGGSLNDVRWLGAEFPYLTSNVDFSGEGALAGLFTPDILPSTAFQSDLGDLAATAAQPAIAPATRILVDGEWIGVVGATTQLLEQITSTGGASVIGPNANDMPALAGILQPVIDDLMDGPDDVAGNGDDVNKVILVSHLQQLALEQALVGLLSGVDIVIAGGSDTLLADGNDILRTGDTAAGDYPLFTTNADSDPSLIVSTDGEYSYVGRLIVEFDPSGVLISPGASETSGDPNVIGVFATDEAGVLRATGESDLATAIANSPKGSEIKKLTDAVSTVVTSKDGTIHGRSGVFLEGRRASVRTQETNLGNLTADANLAAARTVDSSVQVSLKNGGGIRAAIGAVDASTGDLLPTQDNPASGKVSGEVSQLDIENTLRFNNELALVSLTAAELIGVLEHAVSATAPGATPGQFPQVGGLSFSFDPGQSPGSRIRSAAITDDLGNVIDVLLEAGSLIGDPSRLIRMVTLNFLANGGDGYNFDLNGDGDARLDTGVGEQEAMANYLTANHGTIPYYAADTPVDLDRRIQNLDFREDTVTSEVASRDLPLTPISTLPLAGTEISAFDPVSRKLFVTFGGGIQVVDFSNPYSPVLTGVLDPAANGAGASAVTSVAVGTGPSEGIVAVAVPAATETDPGRVLFYDALDNSFLGSIGVGSLPDMVTFTPDGTRVLVANEGESAGAENEPDITPNPNGAVSIVLLDIADLGGSSVSTFEFTDASITAAALADLGIRINPNAPSVAADLEPEYITVTGNTAYVTLQENNAVAVIRDVASFSGFTIADILPLGTKDHTLPFNALDASNRDSGVEIRNAPLFGMYMPDAIDSYVVDGRTYFVTANEGDGRDVDETRVGDYGSAGERSLDPEALLFAADQQDDAVLGRIKSSNVDGDTDGDTDIDDIHVFGGRSFSIWDADGNQVWDSGNFMERFTALSGSFQDGRSDDKGPEPEGITVAQLGGRMIAFVGLERTNDVMVFDITNPRDARFIDNVHIPGDISPEGLTFIDGVASPTGNPLLVITNEVSATVTTIELAPALTITATSSAVAEGGTITGTVTREGALSDPLTVTLKVSDGSEISIPAEVEIPGGQASVDFSIDGIHDLIVDGNQVVTISAEAPQLSTGFFEVAVTDIDSADILVTETDGATQVTEGGTADTVNVALSAMPVDYVVVTVTSSDTSEVVVSTTNLLFDASNWNIPQVVTVTGVDDVDVDGDQVVTVDFAVYAPVSSDEWDGAAPVSIDVTNVDDDAAGPAARVQSVTYYNNDAANERTLTPDSSGQRSIIRRVEIVLDQEVVIPTGAVSDGSFVLTRLDDSTAIDVEVLSSAASGGLTTLVLGFTSNLELSGSLTDGNYELELDGDILGIDGDGNGALGGVFRERFHRYFGDSDGDRDVDGRDYTNYRRGIRGSARFLPVFDYDRDGSLLDGARVDRDDLLEFFARYGTRLDEF